MPAVNEIFAPLGNRMETTTATVYQYNSGMMLRVTGPELPENYRVDFANSVSGQSKSMLGGADGVLIPYEYFVPGSYIHAWIVLTGENYAVTRYHITIPISPRAMPTEEQPSPEQESIINQTIAALNDGVDRAEIAADNAEAAASHYPHINNGYWEIWDPTSGAYVSTGVQAQGAQGEPGPTGSDGQDGVSPTVTVTDIEGGHRITITDADGPHSFDVMDGSSADNAVFIAEYGVTTYSDLLAAFNTGKVLVCKYTKSRQTIYSALYSYQSNDGFRFSVRGQDSSLVSYWFICRPRTGWINSSGPYNAITDPGSVESGDFLVFADANGLNRLTRSNSLKFGADSDKYLANDGTWQDVNPVVTVSGTTPTITALPGVRYVCGECVTLDITLPESGIVDVVFESGSTPTVLTVTPPTGVTLKWANGFDPTALDTNTTYEINIADGLGVAGTWT